MATPQEILDQLSADLGLTLSNAQSQNLLAIIDTAQTRGDDVSLAMLGSVAVRDTLEAEYGELTGATLGQAINRLGEIVTAAEEGEEPPTPEPEPYQALDDALAELQEANEARETFLQEDALASDLVQAEIDDFDPDEEYSDTQVADAVGDALEAAVGDAQAASPGELVIENLNLEASSAIAGTNIVIGGEPLDINFEADGLGTFSSWNDVESLAELRFVLQAQDAIAKADITGSTSLTITTSPGDAITIDAQGEELDQRAAFVDAQDPPQRVGNALPPRGGEAGTSSGVEGALETTREDVAAAVGVLDGLDDAVDYAPENDQVAEGTVDSFDSASRTLQDTFIAESQAVLTEVTEAAEAEVSDITGLSGRIATLQTRKAEFEAALEADFAAEAALDNETAAFNAVNAGTALSGDATSATTIEFDNAALLTRDGDEWSIADDANTDLEGIEALLADVQAAYDADQAKATAEDRFQIAIERVVEAEQGDDFESFEAAADQEYTIESAEDGDVSLDLSDGGAGEHAPLSQALIDLRESQAALDETLLELEETRGLSDQLDTLDNSIAEAKDVFGDELDLNLIDLTDDDTYPDLGDGNNATNASSDSDVVLFKEQLNGEETIERTSFQPFAEEPSQSYTLNLFGEQGQDHLFFGDTAYQLVMLDDTQSINERLGEATELEVFAQQDGANMVFYVESEAAAGTDQNDANVTTLTLTEFSEADIFAFENGRLSTAPVEAA